MVWYLAPWTWLTLGLVAAPLTGTVVDDKGEPAGGVTVWLTAPLDYPRTPRVVSRCETGADGRFTLERPEPPAGDGKVDPLSVWAYRPGSGVALTPLEGPLAAGNDPLRITLGPAATTPVRVFGPDGKPVAGAKVRLFQIHARWGVPPDALAERIEAATDAEGRAAVDGVRPEQVALVDVTARGTGTQKHAFLPPAPGDKVVRLLPVGRVVGQVNADEPEAARGWTVTATTRDVTPNHRGAEVGRAEARSDERGRFTFEALAAGQLSLTVEPPEGSAYLAVRPDMGEVRGGETTGVSLAVARGVKVEGSVREEGTGRPVAGVHLALIGARGGAARYPESDAQGRFSCLMFPGRVSVSVLQVPKTHCRLPADAPGPAGFELAAGGPTYLMPPIEVRRAARVRGTVVDEKGNPVTRAAVNAQWSDPSSTRGPMSDRAITDEHGSFDLGGVSPGSQVELTATLGAPPRAASRAVTVKADGEDDPPLTLRLVRSETVALRGRVLDRGGRPLAGALVRVQVRPQGLGTARRPYDFPFEGSAEVKTGPDGTFRTPDEVPAGHEYRVAVTAAGAEPGESGWVKAPAVDLPDVSLRRTPRLRTVAGRVLDRGGDPVAGAEVFQSGDGPARTNDTTDAEGRFRVPGVYDAPALLFVRKDGFRFTGRLVEPGDAPVEVVVTRSDGPAPPALAPAPDPVSRREERAIAHGLIASARARLISGEAGEAERPVLGALALLEPPLVAGKVGKAELLADRGLLADVALGAFEEGPREAAEAVDALGDPHAAAAALLAVYDRTAATPGPARRGLLDMVAERARRGARRAQRVALLAGVADRWLDLGEPDRASPLIGEAQDLVAKLPRRYDLHPHGELAEAVTRLDLSAAYDLLEGPGVEPHASRRFAGVAVRAAEGDPAEAERLLGLIRDRGLREAARAAVCGREAAKDLPRALALAAGSPDPLLAALLPARAARATAAAAPEGAKARLGEAFDRLEGLAARVDPSSPSSPAVAMAGLLPLAVRVDPGRSEEYLWRALAARPPREDTPPRPPVLPQTRVPFLNLAELAALVAAYNPAAAGAVFAPVAEHVPSLVDENTGLGDEGPAVFRAAAAYDPRAARALLDAMPDDPEPPPRRPPLPVRPGHTARADARLVVARALALPPALRRESVRRHDRPGPRLWPGDPDD